MTPDSPEMIVKALAACEAPIYDDGVLDACRLCEVSFPEDNDHLPIELGNNPAAHDIECPWARAKRFVATEVVMWSGDGPAIKEAP